jgi:S-adenosylmethionine:tRNA ribosyltransferase-isomerase
MSALATEPETALCPPMPALPDATIATAPPEETGVPRDRVRMLVAGPGGLRHRVAADLADQLRPGDVLVVNTSDTLPAALPGVTSTGERVEVHLSTVDPRAAVEYTSALNRRSSRWIAEIRSTGPLGGLPSTADRGGEEIRLAGGGILGVTAPLIPGAHRLWIAELSTPDPLLRWLTGHGSPIRYRYVSQPWPLSAYRTPFADTPGSAEMPSAGRALTSRVFRKLAGRGVETAGIVLHCGVSSLESGDPPYPEWYSVPASTAATVAAAKRDGRRVIAVGTTVVRALESAARATGEARPASGWTDLVITPDTELAAVDGLLTGWHEPEASHLLMLRAVAGCDLLLDSYRAAAEHGYRWHEFGDLHLILPR